MAPFKLAEFERLDIATPFFVLTGHEPNNIKSDYEPNNVKDGFPK